MDSTNKPFRFPVSILIGSTPANILRVINGYRIDVRYYPKFVLSFFIAMIFEILNLAERIIGKRKLRSLQNLQPPVFIIGFWRSGTTLLHSLICQDPKAGYVTTFHGVFPNLVLTQKKWLKALTNQILPKKRPFDGYAMDMDFPQEEDFAMMSLHGKSIYKFFYFPKDYDEIYKNELFFEQLPEIHRKHWEEKYLSLAGKAILNTGGERFISKNPCNIFRIKTLVKLFPEARFIFIYRNPYQVVESLHLFVNEVLPGSELQHLDKGIPREYFARLYKDAMNEYLRASKTIKPEHLIEIRYEEFKERPLEMLRDIYKQFGLPGFEAALPRIEAYLNNNQPHTRKPYPIDKETYRLVNEGAGHVLKNLGYPVIETAKQPL